MRVISVPSPQDGKIVEQSQQVGGLEGRDGEGGICASVEMDSISSRHWIVEENLKRLNGRYVPHPQLSLTLFQTEHSSTSRLIQAYILYRSDLTALLLMLFLRGYVSRFVPFSHDHPSFCMSHCHQHLTCYTLLLTSYMLHPASYRQICPEPQALLSVWDLGGWV